MNFNDRRGNPQHSLRQQAEAKLGKSPTDISRMSLPEIQELTHEFQVYQIELELQNEELRSSQLQLTTTRDQYRKLYDFAPVAYISLNKKGCITNANMVACKLIASSKIELFGIKLGKYIDSEDQDRCYLYFKQLAKSKRIKNIEFRIKQPNNHVIDVACQGYCNAINDNESEDYFFISLQDVSKQKRAEQTIALLNEELKEKVLHQTSVLRDQNKELETSLQEIKNSKSQLLAREAKLDSIFNAAVEGIVTINEKGVIESANLSMTTIFGYSNDELIGKNVKMLMPPSSQASNDDYLRKYLTNHHSKIIGKNRHLEGKRKDGSLLPIDLSVSKFKIANKIYFTGMIRDVSERKQKEILDRQHLDELAHVTRLGLMGEMASGIAHEVNQPLAAIATYSQVCLRMLKDEKPDLLPVQEILEKTEKQALRAGQIISRMREFLTSNKIQRSTIAINDLVHDVMSLVADDCKLQAINCRYLLSDDLPFISVDAIQIEQVLLNLIKNSIDALSKLPDHIKPMLSIQTCFNDNNKIEVRVKDNASGISQHDQEKIFTPFFTTKASGMGMGLSISQSLINAHGGELRFRSKKNKGTTFYFTLPTTQNSYAD